jgi:hypothetical protein
MAKKIIETVEYYDDWDGELLDEKDTKPVTVTLGDVTYDLYLSAANKEKLNEMLDLVRKGTSHTRGGRTTSKGAGRTDRKEVRAWAQTDGKGLLTANGITIPGDRGPISPRVYDAYDKDNK